jgi:hypothetical protein
VATGLTCAAFFAAFTPYNDIKIGATMISGNQFPVGALFVELVLVFVVNVVLRRLRPQWVFTTAELLTVWVLILVASGIPSGGMMRFLIPQIVAPHYHSNTANNWEANLWANLPDALKIRDPAAVKAFYEGYPRGTEHVPWATWTVPLVMWGLLAALFLAASFCMASLLRQQWVENEKFAFPLVSVPLMIAEEPEAGRPLNAGLRNPLLWIAVGICTVIHAFKGLNLLSPTIPDFPLSWNLMDFAPVPPWNQLDVFPVALYPLMIGLTYLLPQEVAFSFWFFFLFYKFQILLCAVNNWQMPGVLGAHGYKQFHALQSFGGAIGLITWILWTARRHLRDVFLQTWRTSLTSGTDEELLSNRATLMGLVFSYGGIVCWLTWAGVPLLYTAFSLFLMTVILIVISWMVCQGGMLFVQTAYGSVDIVAPIRGSAGLSLPGMYTQFRFESSFFLNTREMVTPSVLEGAKAASVVGFSARCLLRAMAASVALTVVISAVASVMLPYYSGGATAINNDWVYNAAPMKPLNLFGGMVNTPFIGSWKNILHVLGGFALTLGLLMCRAYLGFGLHPIGFLGASVSATHLLWFSMFLGWFFKSLILRYGGMKLYLTLLPLFLGLILGDALNAVLWIIIGHLTGTGYRILP